MENEIERLLRELGLAVNSLPQSREKSLVITKIDEAELWLGRLIKNAAPGTLPPTAVSAPAELVPRRDVLAAASAAFDLLRCIYSQPYGLLFLNDEPVQASDTYRRALETVQQIETTYRGTTNARDWTPDTPHWKVHDRRQCLAQGIRAYLFNRDAESADWEIVKTTFQQYFVESAVVETVQDEPLTEAAQLREFFADSEKWSKENRQTAIIAAHAVFDIYREREWLENAPPVAAKTDAQTSDQKTLDWSRAERHLKSVIGTYTELADLPQVNCTPALELVLKPLLARYESGERSDELFGQMMGVE